MTGAVIAFSLASALIVLLPGPDTLVVVRSLVRTGRRGAALTAAGVLSGAMVWVVGAALGISALLRASHDAYLVLRVVGGAYLVWLGVQSLRARGIPLHDDVPAGRRGLLGRGFGAGLATDLLNPKVGVFFVTFLPGFVPAGEPVGRTTLLFGTIFVVESAAYFAVLLLLARRVTAWMARPVVRRRLERVTGVVLVGLGARLVSQ